MTGEETMREVETMIDACQAASALRLPYYWFSHCTVRTTKRIPHYVLGRLVRFRLSELTVWAKATDVLTEEETP